MATDPSFLDREETPLPTLALGITAKCNFHCEFCVFHGREMKPFRSYGKYAATAMSLEDIGDIVRRLRPGRVSLGVTGEPFLFPEMPALLDLLAGEGCLVSCSTNGTAPGFLEIMERYGSIFSAVNISLDATTQDEYARLSPNAQLSDTLAILQSLGSLIVSRGWKTSLEVNFVVPAHDGWPDFVRRGVALFRRMEIPPLGRVSFNTQSGYKDDTLTLKGDAIPALRELSDALLQEGPYPFEVVLPTPVVAQSPNRCRDPWLLVSVSPDFGVAPCCRVAPDRNLGNLREDPGVFWSGESFLNARFVLARGGDPFKECSTCSQRSGVSITIPRGATAGT